ncbi:MAG: 3-phosphoshikimate 1-carboxyvinyltransferase [Deltaproteobacteria bacterium]|nr:MAG: 3-phosphoshikimate 1-carboxyvinyltransferase [Deltaproteobacteria bacterium]
MRQVSDSVTIRPRGPLDARLRVPGSRSITNRALEVAALAAGQSQLEGALDSDDTQAMREGLVALGATIDVDGDTWSVSGTDGRLRTPTRPLDARASGTTARFLTALATLARGSAVIDGTPRMRERPIEDLTLALSALGARVEVLGEAGCPPVRTGGGGLRGGAALVDARRSSQYVSALLMVAPYASRDVTLSLEEGICVSRPYVELTLAVMDAFGACAGWNAEGGLHVEAGRHYGPRRYRIEPDASSAAYGFAAAAIAGGTVVVEGLPADSRQPDVRFLDVLEKMGCEVTRNEDGDVAVRGQPGSLHGVDVDMNALPDAALALAVVALFAKGPTVIRNVANLRIKETDRLAALEAEIRKLGAQACATQDSLTIEPGPLRGAEIETYDDHRMAMSFALAGLQVPGVVIRDPGCVRKTWPDFFEALERL